METKIIIVLLIIIGLTLTMVVYTKGNIKMTGGAFNPKYKKWSCVPGSTHAFKIRNNRLLCVSGDGKRCLPNVCKDNKIVYANVPRPFKTRSCNISSPWLTRKNRSLFPSVLLHSPPAWCANIIKRLQPVSKPIQKK